MHDQCLRFGQRGYLEIHHAFIVGMMYLQISAFAAGFARLAGVYIDGVAGIACVD